MDVLESGSAQPRPLTSARRLAQPLATETAVRSLAAVAVVALFAAEVLPWASVRLGTVDGDIGIPSELAHGLNMYVVDLPTGLQVSFQLGWALLLGVLGVAVFGPARLRRGLAGAVGGLALGQLALVASLFAGGDSGGGPGSLYANGSLRLIGDQITGSLSVGLFCAGVAALCALAVGLLTLRLAATTPSTALLAGPPPGYPLPGYAPAGYPLAAPLPGQPAGFPLSGPVPANPPGALTGQPAAGYPMPVQPAATPAHARLDYDVSEFTRPRPASEFAAPDHRATEFAAPDHGASEFAAPDHGASEFAAPDHRASEFAAPDHRVSEHARPEHDYTRPGHSRPELARSDYPRPGHRAAGLGEPLDLTVSAVPPSEPVADWRADR